MEKRKRKIKKKKIVCKRIKYNGEWRYSCLSIVSLSFECWLTLWIAFRFRDSEMLIITVMCLQWFWQPYHNETHDTYESALNDLVPHMRNPCTEKKRKKIAPKKKRNRDREYYHNQIYVDWALNARSVISLCDLNKSNWKYALKSTKIGIGTKKCVWRAWERYPYKKREQIINDGANNGFCNRYSELLNVIRLQTNWLWKRLNCS